MSTSNPSDVVTIQLPSYPTYEELNNSSTRCFRSIAADRIFWTLDSPFPAAISVMKDKHSPTSLEPYFFPSSSTYHPVSLEPFSSPKVSSITVRADDLEQYEYLWKEEHTERGGFCVPEKGRWYGNLEDYDTTEDSDQEEHLLGCCGEPRPRKKKAKVVVRAADGGDGFVTVNDYLSTVHPWLMSVKWDIVRSNALRCREFEAMMVGYASLDCLWVEEKADWIKALSKVPNPVDVSTYAKYGSPYDPANTWPVFGPENK